MTDTWTVYHEAPSPSGHYARHEGHPRKCPHDECRESWGRFAAKQAAAPTEPPANIVFQLDWEQ